MKILLVQPDSTNEVVNRAMHIYNFEPLGLYYLAATVKEHHDMELLDLNNEVQLSSSGDRDPFAEALALFCPDIVAFSALTAPRTGRIKELAHQVKRADSHIATMVGGVHAALYPIDFQSEDVDLVVTTHAMEVFPECVRRLEDGRSMDEVQEYCVSSEQRPSLLTMRDWPSPHRAPGRKYAGCYTIASGVPGVSKLSHPISSVKTSSGCPFRCNFCCLWRLYPKHETVPVDRAVAEIASVDTEFVFLADDESLVDVDYANDLALALEASGVRKKLVMYGRSDTIAGNAALVANLAAAGLYEVWIGLEGASDQRLKDYDKKLSVQSHLDAIRTCSDHGIRVHTTALVEADFTRQDFRSMLSFVRDTLGLESNHFFVLTPLKGTPLYDDLMGSTPERFLTDDSDDFSIRQSVLRPAHMSIEEFHIEFADLLREFNSSTMPLRLDGEIPNEGLARDFEYHRSRNEALLEAIVHSHESYVAP